MDVLHIPPSEEEEEAMEVESEGNGEQGEGGKEASSPMGSSTDEETDEDSEPEPPQVTRRKVSFADAFGLNLVSVKEFDNPEVAVELEVNRPTKNEATRPPVEFYVSCLFAVPSTPEELDQRLQEQMVELESIELLPGTTTLRGTVRVVNLCYHKSVYARMSLDRWTSYFDLSAEYVPGSSDWKTDRFTFRHTLVPPFEREGTRVELCLRYETSVGTFWANCKEMNYVLYCHQKRHVKEHEVQVQEESIGCQGKRSCLKANRRGCAEEKTRKSSKRSTDATLTAEEADRGSSSDVQPSLCWEGHKPLVESIKSRNRAERMARVQGYLSQRGQPASKAHSQDSANGQKASQPLSTLWGRSPGFAHKHHKKHSVESPQVLTYHQIPLLTLDWNNDKARKSGAADMAGDIYTARAKMNSSQTPQEKIADTPPASDTWGTFSNGADDTTDKKSSVCNAWQASVNGLSCTERSGVPESEWLQTAASVSPSNEEEPNARRVASSPEHECQAGTEAHTPESCQPLSDARQTALAQGAVDAEDMTTESQNAAAADKISRGARADEGYSPRRDGEVRGAAHNAMDNTVAFRGTIRRETRDGGRFVFSASRQGTEERSMESRGAADEEISRPRKTVECNISQRCADEEQREEDPLQANESDRNEVRPAKTNADESNSSQTYVRQSQNMAAEFKWEESEREDVASNNKDFGVSKQTEVEPCSCTAINEINTLTGVEEGIIQVLNEDHHDKALKHNSSWKTGNPSIISGVHNKQTGSIKAGEQESIDQSEDSTVTPVQGNAVESETEEDALVSNQTEEGKGLSDRGIIAKQLRITAESREIKKVFQGDHDAFRHSLTDKCSQKPVEVAQMRWTHSQDDTKGPSQDGGRETTPEEVNSKKDTSAELEHQPETLKRRKGDMTRRDGDDSVSIGKLEIEVPGELMGNAEIARGETENAAAELKEHEMSAEVESSSRVEYKKLSVGTKDPITAESATALEARDSGREEVFMERFGDDLVRRIWEEVFRRYERPASKDTDIVDGAGGALADAPDIAQDCRPPSEEDFNDAFESGALSSTHLPTDQNVSACQGLQTTSAAKGTARPPKETRRSLATTAEQTHFLSAPQTDLNSRGNLGRDFAPVLAAQSLSESAGGSPRDRESCTRVKEETVRPKEDPLVPNREGWRPSGRTSHKRPSGAGDASREPSGVPWRSVFSALGQFTRLVICILLVAGFSLVVFLSDFQALLALYAVSSCWWFYEWKLHRVTKGKGVAG
ncbi:uncharacterized protein ppp1r3aa isoform X2 [Pungitius pungitius]|uniref:uncharacterized protein ppp1r3aa isoform X2 n=1 Tax=Pungitius pungitius TaxID=134920 RepID=UPI002E11DA08